jgi:hypothetical protein
MINTCTSWKKQLEVTGVSKRKVKVCLKLGSEIIYGSGCGTEPSTRLRVPRFGAKVENIGKSWAGISNEKLLLL